MTTIEVQVLRAALMEHGIILKTHLQTRPLTKCYEGALRSDGQEVFVKVLDSMHPKVRRNFLREIDVLEKLKGPPHLPRIVASSIEPPVTFHACMSVPGACLYSLASTHTLRSTLTVAAKLASSILHLHEKGFAHRDLSPDHVFLGKGGHHTIIDFGMSKCLLSETSKRALLYKGYDIQAFGMIVWEMICGGQVFPYRSDGLMAAVHREIDIIHSVALPGALAQALTACLSIKSEFNPGAAAPPRCFLRDIVQQFEGLQIQFRAPNISRQ